MQKELLDWIADFEKFKSKAYKDPADVWTIGYGTTRIYGFPITEDMVINEPVGRVLLTNDVDEAMGYVLKLVKIDLNINQLYALTDFVYNLGPTNFGKSTLLKKINNNQPIARNNFTDWNKARVKGVLKVLPGLTTRRNKEYNLFIKEV